MGHRLDDDGGEDAKVLLADVVLALEHIFKGLQGDLLLGLVLRLEGVKDGRSHQQVREGADNQRERPNVLPFHDWRQRAEGDEGLVTGSALLTRSVLRSSTALPADTEANLPHRCSSRLAAVGGEEKWVQHPAGKTALGSAAAAAAAGVDWGKWSSHRKTACMTEKEVRPRRQSGGMVIAKR